MKTKDDKKELPNMSDAELLALVAEKLKNREDLFPQSTADAREFMKKAKFIRIK